ncbi:10985_t:CDS:2, partial [Dentiscutata heterogama]
VPLAPMRKILVQQNLEKEKQECKKNREQQKIAAKINWKKKGFVHFHQSKSEQLKNLLPHDISECQALNDIKKIVAKSGYYSDEISETDDELADDERRKKIQHPLDDDLNNHVVKIIYIYIDTTEMEWWETDIDDNSTPPAGAPSWCISCNYVLAISLGPVINSPSAGDDSDNYLESCAIASNTHF